MFGTSHLHLALFVFRTRKMHLDVEQRSIVSIAYRRKLSVIRISLNVSYEDPSMPASSRYRMTTVRVGLQTPLALLKMQLQMEFEVDPEMMKLTV